MLDPNKLALIIGMDIYYTDGLDSLPSCKKDADDMFKLLQDLEYTIIDDVPIIGSALDKVYGWAKIREKIDYFFANAKPSQQLLFYFSGHGVHGGDQIFLATPQIDLKSPSTFGYSLAELTKHMGESKSKRIIGIVDACYSGDAGLPHQELKKKSAKDNVGRALAKYDTIWKNTPKTQGVTLLLSSQAYEESNAIRNSNSLYTKYVIEGLKGVRPQSDKNDRIIKESGSVDENGDVTPASLHEYVYNKVANITDQVPKIESNDPTGIILASYPTLVKPKSGKELELHIPEEAENYAELLMKEGEYDKSIISNLSKEKLVEIENKLEKGNFYYSAQNYNLAIACYTEALEIEPKYVRALYNKSRALEAMDQPEEAIKHLNKILEIEPTNLRTLNNKGTVLRSLDKDDEAIACFNKALEIDPKYARAWNSKGSSLIEHNKLEALACFNKALEIEPDNVYALNRKGGTLTMLGNYEEAIACYNKALEIDPNNKWAKRGKFSALEHSRQNMKNPNK